jgi:plastocyanin
MSASELSVPSFLLRKFAPGPRESSRALWLPFLVVSIACYFLLALTFEGAPSARVVKAKTMDHFAALPPSFFTSPFPLPAEASATTVTLNGRVSYEGTPKKLKPIDMSTEPKCANFYNTPPMPDNAVSGSDNSLPNVIVYISAGAPDENFAGPVVHLNQRGCRYAPHVVAVQANQEVWVQNDDSVTHSVHPLAQHNAEWNRSQPPGTPPVVIRYSQPEFIKVKCELHSWMRGVLAVFKNSHHAVTDSTGSFTLNDLPPGKYTITAWHETYGTQSKEVTIAAGQNPDLNFVFKVTPY